MYPIGYVFLTIDSGYNPNGHFTGVWVLLTGGYVLKTITSGAGGNTSNAGNTGDCTLTTAQIPSHSHSYTTFTSHNRCTYTGGPESYTNMCTGSRSISTGIQGSGKAHNHTAGMPANIGVYAWKRTE